MARGKITIAGSSVTLAASTSAVTRAGAAAPAVTKVRYAWADYVDCVLVNNDSLPAGPFVANVTASSPFATASPAAAKATPAAAKATPAAADSSPAYATNSSAGGKAPPGGARATKGTPRTGG